MMASIFQRSALMPAASAAGSFCLMASSDMPKRERSTCSDTIMQTTVEDQRQRHVDALVVELDVERRRFAHHRQVTS